MLIERSLQPDWLSNAYVVADKEGGTAVFVDSGADLAPLVAAVEGWGATPAAILRTHAHHDHIAHEHELRARYDVPDVAETGEWEWAGLRVRGGSPTDHYDARVAVVHDAEAVNTGG